MVADLGPARTGAQVALATPELAAPPRGPAIRQ